MRLTHLIVLAALLLTACAQIGPGTIDRDRFDYGNAIANSWQRQTLLNLLRLRYGEIPQFVEVTSVINQYALEGEVSAGVAWVPDVWGETVNGRAAAKWADRPTITYAPLAGKALTERLLKPIDPASVLFLAEGGWPVEFIFPLTVRRANGLSNATVLRSFEGQGEVGFFRLVEVLGALQKTGTIGMRLEKRDEGEAAVMFLSRGNIADDESHALLSELRELLDLDPEASEYLLTYGALPRDRTEIALLTKSALEIMVDLARWIDVPEEHVAETRTLPTQEEKEFGAYTFKRPIRIRSDAVPAGRAMVSARFRGTTFWIDDSDLNSKRTFAFLQFMFSIVESNRKQLSPVVTVGAGGA